VVIIAWSLHVQIMVVFSFIWASRPTITIVGRDCRRSLSIVTLSLLFRLGAQCAGLRYPGAEDRPGCLQPACCRIRASRHQWALDARRLVSSVQDSASSQHLWALGFGGIRCSAIGQPNHRSLQTTRSTKHVRVACCVDDPGEQATTRLPRTSAQT
jgi:hypothetical protein